LITCPQPDDFSAVPFGPSRRGNRRTIAYTDVGFMMIRTRSRLMVGAALAWLCAGGLEPHARGQLAITEAMSSASERFGTNVVTALCDFWELTNFGTNEIDLSGYRWNDTTGGLALADTTPFANLRIGPRASIIFIETNTTDMATAEAFREWWGPGLPTGLQIIPYFGRGNGLNPVRDGIRLWGPNAVDDADVVDKVDFDDARQGSTFTYDPGTGLFGYISVEGVDGAFRAATRDDVGSPGIVTGSIPIYFVAEPANVNVCAGIDASFSIIAGGLPKPKCQWYFNSNALEGATAPTLTVSNAQAGVAGNYFAELSNGFEVLRSAVVKLSIDAHPTPPVPFAPFRDVAVLVGETARFSAVACALPAATYQWFTTGVPVLGANSRNFEIPNAVLEMSGTMVCVEIVNSLGSTNLCARLTVSPKPRLEITEVMALASINCAGHGDWFEITNRDTNNVDLLGYRFASIDDDQPSLEGAFQITNSVVLRPQQSAIFVERIDANAFAEWWGRQALPAGLQIISYFGHGLSQNGDSVILWSGGTEDPNEWITWTSFSGSSNGVSKYFDGECWPGCDNVMYERGAFQAATCGDVGSPGYTENSPPRLLSISKAASGVMLRWSAIIGRTYRLNCRSQFDGGSWSLLSLHEATGSIVTVSDPGANTSQRFYMVEEVR